MNRFVVLVLAISVLATGCSFASLLPDPVDPACQAHASPADCQAALVVAMDGLGFDLDAYVVSIAPISCADGQCTTWVSAMPATDDCVPSYDAELARETTGSWKVVMLLHGDPPCAFGQ